MLREKRILVRSALSADGRAKTLAHELAHHFLNRNADASEADRGPLSSPRPKGRRIRSSLTSAWTLRSIPSHTWRVGRSGRR
ncbi:MAG: ImmA/IrrE family metallo-endopeptidase [Rubrobacteraceae bacterium]